LNIESEKHFLPKKQRDNVSKVEGNKDAAEMKNLGGLCFISRDPRTPILARNSSFVRGAGQRL